MSQSSLLHHDYFKKHQDELLTAWQSELQKNETFSDQNSHYKAALTAKTKQYLPQFMTLLNQENVPSFSIQAFEPALKFWRHFLKEHQNSGLTIRDMALMILSLKSTLSKWENQENSEFDSFNSLLDFLGILTFEIYRHDTENSHPKLAENLSPPPNGKDTLFGNSAAMKRIYQMVSLILDNDISVLLEGESGTGKDVLATYIHTHSKRKNKPFIPINCGAIPKELIESELFGHEKGAFTGADTKHPGKFEQAEGGTLFLDEIGELPLDVQVKLLRVLQNKEITRVGGTSKIKVNARIIAATNAPLKALVDQKRFRLDLYYRLNVFPIHLPSLRERKEDILPLAYSFLESYAKTFSVAQPSLSQGAENYLLNHMWEGNIRELENVMQRSVILAQGHTITPDLLSLIPSDIYQYQDDFMPSQTLLPEGPIDTSKIRPLEEVEKEAILKALTSTNHNMLKTAKLLGISRTTLYNKMEKYQLGEK